MFYKKLQDITYADICELMSNKVIEHRKLEYKEQYKIDGERETGEFLADISSFANDVGGYILYGVKAKDGFPTAIDGIQINDVDAEKLKIEGKILQAIAPRLKVEFHTVQIPGSSQVIFLIKIPQSWQSPHRVTFTAYPKTKDQFYSRNSSGKYQLDVMELRQTFLRTDSLATKIDNFLTHRIEIVSNNATSIPLVKGGKIVLHLVPVEAFSSSNHIDLTAAIASMQSVLPVNSSCSAKPRVNLEGILSHEYPNQDGSIGSYLQLYRNGVIEAVEGRLLSDTTIERYGKGQVILSVAYEKVIRESLKSYMNLFNTIGINVPIVASLSLVGVKGFTLSDATNIDCNGTFYKIDNAILKIPTQIIENFSDDYDKALKNMFDIVWNACGQLNSRNFNADGNWIDRR